MYIQQILCLPPNLEKGLERLEGNQGNQGKLSIKKSLISEALIWRSGRDSNPRPHA